ncbi:MAG: FAD-binding protein [Bacteroidales bacterium]
MESETLRIGDFIVRYYQLNTLVIGSGAASLNAAVSLSDMGQEDIMIATTKWGAGTSNNAGSDKQTYYKLSLCGEEPDSVRIMARDLFNGKCMHGDIALCEAQGSVQTFMRLVALGVPFPHDKFGAWAGYKTDNDPRARATSAGPRTSGMMFRVLSREVKRLKIKILDKHNVIALLTDKTRARVTGAIALNTKEKDPRKAFVLVNAVNIVLGTGGPGDLYSASVYPLSQKGSTGMAFRAGATGQNLTESQFGISSLKFRWNLSGSYQQVIPRYYSCDKNGNGEREFLNDYFTDYKSLTRAIFLKGYQWPFDPVKITGQGSSLIDLLVFREKEEKRRKVFIDFTRNVSLNGEDSFSGLDLDGEVYGYLSRSGALLATPFERLRAMNPPAIELYREHGIDLATEPVEIGICAQHNNGGLKGNIWWESDLKHLFPVGEVNGSHGVSRPGGAALNSGQVGSFRAARFISRKYSDPPPVKKKFLASALEETSNVFQLAEGFLSRGRSEKNNKIIREIRERMSANAGIIRSMDRVSRALEEAHSLLNSFPDLGGATSVLDLAVCFRIYDNCLAHTAYLEAIKTYIEKGGRSRGSYLVADGEIFRIDADSPGSAINLCSYDRSVESDILELRFLKGKFVHNHVKVREIPDQDLWFEKVWKDYLEDKYLQI